MIFGCSNELKIFQRLRQSAGLEYAKNDVCSNFILPSLSSLPCYFRLSQQPAVGQQVRGMATEKQSTFDVLPISFSDPLLCSFYSSLTDLSPCHA
jgi:hypothetical protein